METVDGSVGWDSCWLNIELHLRPGSIGCQMEFYANPHYYNFNLAFVYSYWSSPDAAADGFNPRSRGRWITKLERFTKKKQEYFHLNLSLIEFKIKFINKGMTEGFNK